MDWVKDLTDAVNTILTTDWTKRSGNVVPESDDVTLKDGAVELEATFFYADLAGSSTLAKFCPWETTAKVIRAYLDCCVRLIRAYRGEIRSFDGDRVMAIFKGDTANSDAVKCAREIDWMVTEVLNPVTKQEFASIRNNNINIRHCIGIDSGQAVAVRAGIRANNDLIWIGHAPSFAAKLSDVRTFPYEVYITESVYLAIDGKNQTNEGVSIWVQDTFEFAGTIERVYKTRFILTP